MQATKFTYNDLLKQLEHLKYELSEAKDTIEAIRTGQVDALIVDNGDSHEIYTLTSADQTYRLFIETMTEGAVTINKDGVILYSNSQFANMMGLEISSVLGANFKDFVSGRYEEDFEALFESAWLHDNKAEVELNNELQTSALVSLTTFTLDEGKFLSAIITDLSALKENEKQLEYKNNELRKSNIALEISNNDLMQFASVASHDLQEPLRKVMVFLGLFRKAATAQLSAQATGYLDKIQYSSEKMKQLIIDILNYSRLSAEDNVYEEVDLNALVKDLIQDYELMIEEKQAVISLEDLPTLVVNRGQIRQVFQNIISNALKFSKTDIPAVLRIKATFIRELDFNATEDPGGNYCKMSISDNGIGFDEKYLQNVFSLFERLNPKDRFEGSGIGMSIAKKIIEKHKGLITARSKEDDGAEFIIILPVKQ